MNLGELSQFLYEKPLMGLTIAAILVSMLAGMLTMRYPRLSHGLRNTAYLGLTAALLLTVASLASNAHRSDAALWLDQVRPASIQGTQTVLPLRTDNHFWVEAQLNGEPVNFLIDTGATYTGISQSVARRAGIVPDQGDEGVMLDTANGTIVARMATASSLRFGSIEATSLPIAIGPDNEVETNVIGMNLLSQLGSWRVQNNQLILEPKPAAKADKAD
ncbi:TIGR02281 family clan AA aspartic protease [Novosphingobium sp. BL-8H]|uniref:retropepsin-like aspartic protease family protein n=1 Tax=Novosphingobium sp. BL-8H TaxID=3127640 RepID=UPI00375848D5